MPYTPPQRNFDGIQHADVRRHSDPAVTDFHDAVSAAYYDGTDLILAGHNFGQIDEAQFNRLHSLAHALQRAAMHYANLQTRRGGGQGSLMADENSYRYEPVPDPETGEVIGQRDVIADAQAELQDVLGDYPELGAYEATIPNPRNPNQTQTVTLAGFASYNLDRL